MNVKGVFLPSLFVEKNKKTKSRFECKLWDEEGLGTWGYPSLLS